MSTLAEIEAAIERLPDAERAQLARWLPLWLLWKFHLQYLYTSNDYLVNGLLDVYEFLMWINICWPTRNSATAASIGNIHDAPEFKTGTAESPTQGSPICRPHTRGDIKVSVGSVKEISGANWVIG